MNWGLLRFFLGVCGFGRFGKGVFFLQRAGGAYLGFVGLTGGLDHDAYDEQTNLFFCLFLSLLSFPFPCPLQEDPCEFARFRAV